MSYADAMRYFRTKLKDIAPEPVDSTEGVVGPQVHKPTVLTAPEVQEPRDTSSNAITSSVPQTKLPDVNTRRTSLKTPQVKPYEPSPRPVRKPGEDDLTWKTRWRRWQIDEQVMENLLQGATGPVLRGRPNRAGVCFGNCPPFNCTCHDEGPFQL